MKRLSLLKSRKILLTLSLILLVGDIVALHIPHPNPNTNNSQPISYKVSKDGQTAPSTTSASDLSNSVDTAPLALPNTSPAPVQPLVTSGNTKTSSTAGTQLTAPASPATPTNSIGSPGAGSNYTGIWTGNCAELAQQAASIRASLATIPSLSSFMSGINASSLSAAALAAYAAQYQNQFSAQIASLNTQATVVGQEENSCY